MTQETTPRIDNIVWAFKSDGSFHTEADYNFPGTTQKPRHVPHDIPGYQFEYYLLLSSKLTPDNFSGNLNTDGSVKTPTDPNYTTSPDERDVARIIHDFNWIIYAPAPPQGVAIQSGIAPSVN